jgi:hypothetical protein
MHLRSLGLARDQHLQAELLLQPLAQERLLHGEARTQQPQHLHTGCTRSRPDRVGYVHKRNRHGCRHLIRHPVHGVGAKQHTVGTPGLQAPGSIGQQRRRIVPAACMLGLLDRAEVHAVHQQSGRAQRTQTLPDTLVDQAVVLGAGLPAHAADQA